uniref:Uncharacterized protein LOC111120395 n=1 Tax=Crassostrea virginica TaxID=6565 RepID=A0A8B8CNQ5_CRAVI|nr:uncharacterized protein LOC111120395 [Crassostrea virginica]
MDENKVGLHYTECDKCRQNVKYFCVPCDLNLCQGCKEEHLRDGTSRSHDVRMYRERYATLFPERCDRHTKKKYIYTKYCRECLVSLCDKCARGHSHRGHEQGDITEAYHRQREKYRKWYQKIQMELLPQCTDKKDHVQKKLERERDLYEDMLNRLNTQAVKVKRLIDEKVAEITTTCTNHWKSQIGTLRTTKGELSSKITHMKNIIENFEDSANHPAKFLMFVKDNPMNELQYPEVCDPPLPSFVEGELDRNMIEKLLGRVETNDLKAFITYSARTEKKTLNVPELTSIRHISCLATNRVWISDNTRLICINLENMEKLHKVSVPKDSYGCHTVNDKDELFFIDIDQQIVKLSNNLQECHPVLKVTKPWEPISVHISTMTNTLLIGMIIPLTKARVVRQSGSGQEEGDLEDVSDAHELYEAPAYITENKNGDVIVSDYKKKAVIAVSSSGRHRFSYRGPPLGHFEELWPRGVCIDNQANILVSNFNSRSGAELHVLDKDGHVLKMVVLDVNLKKLFGMGSDLVKKTFMVGSSSDNTLYASQMSDILA